VKVCRLQLHLCVIFLQHNRPCCMGMMQVQNARDKLQGKHPSDVLLAELAPKHSSTKHWAALQVCACSLPFCETAGVLSKSQKVRRGYQDCAGK
jgi:hypothetical protein